MLNLINISLMYFSITHNQIQIVLQLCHVNRSLCHVLFLFRGDNYNFFLKIKTIAQRKCVLLFI